jgi:hypothetical protein
MGHFLFLVLHLIALVAGAVLLFVTIPSHLIYIAIKGRKQDSSAPSPETHVKCPDCRELVLKDARTCKHCGCKLVPQA